MTALDRFFDGLDTLIGWVTATLLAVAYALSVFGVVERYLIPGSGTDWLMEVVVFSIIWAVLLSVARIEHRRAHIRMDIVWRTFGDKGKTYSEYAVLLLGLMFSVILVYSGWLVVQDAIMWDERTDSSLRLPYWIYYLSLASAFSVHILFVLHRLTLLARNAVEFDHGDLSAEIAHNGDYSD
ncbi:TRAP transporter small permease [Pseudoprimorskyibacter insulae]|uniref:TRAP transporter small permease protein n=1 Tax=Pseudoprimorskyibacter insulae TaxID=1695997 RepID=A0A2R8APF4_9RHOB|nr:TRAP transporter small permease [Pseudoprimorskyibacter insulae]SPF77942.1 hypothetical protein PRI8871_00530 [Pseudoprimorskyibacter insulae]